MSETVKTPEELKKDTESQLEAAKKMFDTFKKDYKDKLYAIKASTESLAYTKNFMESESKFKGLDALGVIEVTKALDKKPIKDGVFFLKGLEVQALCYFMEKYEGQGRKNAVDYIEAYKPVAEALQLVKKDNDQFNDFTNKIAVLEESLTLGISIAPEPELEVQINS